MELSVLFAAGVFVGVLLRFKPSVDRSGQNSANDGRKPEKP
jgi:hypothetical protein